MTNKSKLTLIVDGNWLLMSRLAVISGRYPDTNELNRELKLLMIRSINLVLRTFPIIDNIIFVADGGSWRNSEVAVPLFLQNDGIEYKGNREHSDDIDWDVIFSGYEDFLNVLKTNGVTVSKEKMIEGDDWIWYWTRRLNENGVNTVIWSSDNDLKQLIQNDSFNGSITAWYNDRNGVWFSDDLNEDQLDDLDFFMQPIRVKSPLLENLKQSSRTSSYIKPDDIVMEKIICGDAGDNIKSIAKTISGSKTYKVSIKMWNEIKSNLNINCLEEFFKSKYDIIDEILSIKKFANCNSDDLAEMFDYNIKLVWLNESVIPETIVMYMNQLDYSIADISYIKSNFRTMCKRNTTIEDIFESI